MRITQVFAGSRPKTRASLGATASSRSAVAPWPIYPDGRDRRRISCPSELGLERDVVFTHAGQRVPAHLTSGSSRSRRVALTARLPGGSRLWICVFSNFVEPSFEDARRRVCRAGRSRRERARPRPALQRRRSRHRAQHLASLIGGARTRARCSPVLPQRQENLRNSTLRFQPNRMRWPRSSDVITTIRRHRRASSSSIRSGHSSRSSSLEAGPTASRLGQYAIPFCDKVLAAVAFPSATPPARRLLRRSAADMCCAG